jgi:GTP-binding protein HflX
VNLVLEELGIHEDRRSQIIEVWNKADLLDPLALATREAQAQRRDDCVLVSSLDGQGIDELLEKVEKRLAKKSTVYEIMIDAADGKGMAWLHQRGEVLARKAYADGRTKLSVRFDPDTAGQAQSKFGKAMKAKT